MLLLLEEAFVAAETRLDVLVPGIAAMLMSPPVVEASGKTGSLPLADTTFGPLILCAFAVFGASDEVPVLLVDADVFLVEVAAELVRETRVEGRAACPLGIEGFLGLGAIATVPVVALAVDVDAEEVSGLVEGATAGTDLDGAEAVAIGALALVEGAGAEAGCETVEMMLFITFAAPRSRPNRLPGAALAINLSAQISLQTGMETHLGQPTFSVHYCLRRCSSFLASSSVFPWHPPISSCSLRPL